VKYWKSPVRHGQEEVTMNEEKLINDVRAFFATKGYKTPSINCRVVGRSLVSMDITFEPFRPRVGDRRKGDRRNVA